jgi:hypothetical protein
VKEVIAELAECQRHQDEIEPARADRHRADHGRQRGSAEDCDRRGGEHVGGLGLRRHHREQIGRNSIERGVAEADQPGRPDHEPERDRETRLDRDGGGKLDLVARPDERHQQRRRCQQDQQTCVDVILAHVPVPRNRPCGRAISTAIIAA